MLTSSCPHVCTSTLFMLWDGNQPKKPIHYLYVQPFKRCVSFCWKVDRRSTFLQWVKFISFVYIPKPYTSSSGCGQPAINGHKDILVFFKSNANGPSFTGQTACIAPSLGFALILFFVVYLTYSLCKHGCKGSCDWASCREQEPWACMLKRWMQ